MLSRLRWTTLILGIPVFALVQDGDPPARVARLSYQSGTVSFRPGTVDEWGAASVNYPLTSGDHLWTDRGAQAEMHIGGNAVRMSAETALAFLNLDDRTVQISVTQGSAQIHIRTLEPDETFEVDTPNAAITLLRPGDYRVDADGDKNLAVLTVRGGDAAVTAAGEAFTVHARETARIRGVDTVSHDIATADGLDEFEQWCDARDRREEGSPSAQYVPREMTGYEDLDTYGSWRDDGEYGWVWAPRVTVADWAPYRYGHWAWVQPWGWTWIDDAPWGFAPFHYGRWTYTGVGWVWVPGRRVIGVRPVYAPALVVFVGGAGARAAWFPLGPREVYRPAYRVSPVYVRNVNITHVTDVTVISSGSVTNVRYVNRRMGGITATSGEVFAGGRHIGAEAARIDTREIEHAPVAGFAAPIPPRRESVVFGRGTAPPVRVVERTVVVRNKPAAAPVSFGARQRALADNPGRPLDPVQVESLRRAEPPPRPMVRTIQPASPAPQRPVVGTQSVQEREPQVRSIQRPSPDPNSPRKTEAQRRENPPVRAEPRKAERPQRPPEQPKRTDQPRDDRQPHREQRKTPRKEEKREP